MFKKLNLILMLAFLVIAGNTKAAHVYWKPSSGNDSNNGTSTSTPVKTLARAIEVLKTQYQANPSGNWIIIQMEEWTIANTDNGEIVIDGKIDDTHNALVLRDASNAMRNSYIIKYTETTNSGANTLKLSNITFNGNSEGNSWSQGNGNQNKPIIVIGQNRTVIMEDGCVLTNNQHTKPSESTLNGAGVVINDGATLVMNGGEISKCKSNNYGAGVYNGTGGTFTMNGGEIFECQAGGTANYGETNAHPRGSGGGVYMGPGSTVTIAGGEIRHCTAYQFGGGMKLQGSADRQTTATITKCNIHDCTANTTTDNYGRGGGIDFAGNVVATIEGDEVLIHNNRCQCYGGGIQLQAGATAYFKKGKIYNNTAVRHSIEDAQLCGAAGVHSTNDCHFNMSGGEIYDNYTPGVGGGIHTSYEGTLEITGGKIYGNHASCQGGAINLNTNCNLRIPEGSTLQMYDNTAGRGGAVCCDAANVWIYAGSFHDNHAVDTVPETEFTKGIGGAFSLIMERTQTGHEFRPANMYIYGGEIYNNTASVDGGAIYLKKNSEQPTAGVPTMHIQGGKLYNNTAYKGNGGAIFADDETTFYMEANEEVTPSTKGEIYGNEAKLGNGGAVYLGKATVYISAGSFSENTAKLNGGGFFLNEGNVTISGGSILGNTATNDGGGFYVSDGNITITDGEVKNNTATTGSGGGFYTAGGTVNISKAEICGNKARNGFGGGLYSAAAITVGTNEAGSGATISGNYAKDGAGFYVAGPASSTTTIQGGSVILGNKATNNGGGAYIASGNLTVNNCEIKSDTAILNGGGFFVNGGILTLTGGTIGANGHPNTATNGGGFYMQGGVANITGGTVQYNEATNGGGLYMLGASASSKATANFTDGYFQYNSASEAGGGIYVAENSVLNMSATSNIQHNHVPAGKKGGGVMVDKGKFMILGGEGSTLTVMENYAGAAYAPECRNNVFLNAYDDVISVDENNDISRIFVGVSVDGTLPTPIIHCANTDRLNNIFQMMKYSYDHPEEPQSCIFDDAKRYEPLWKEQPPVFLKENIYFVKTWFSEVLSEPDGFSFDNIDSPEDLTWFAKLANRIVNSEYEDADFIGNITADLDMQTLLWIPFGEYHNAENHTVYTTPFKGKLKGNGHAITNLSTDGLMSYTHYGLFARTQGAEITNLILTDCDIYSGETQRMGCIVAEMDGGLLENCMAGGRVMVTGSETQDGGGEFYCVAGGLVGETKGDAVIRNCISSVNVEAEKNDGEIYVKPQNFTVGGLAGKTSVGTIVENCLVNTTIKHSGDPDPSIEVVGRYVGGIVGYNQGEITNTYVRLDREGTTLDATFSKFGMFAGNNTGSISYCYAPDEHLFSLSRNYVHTSETGSTLSNYGEYDAVVRPYKYATYLLDNKVTKIDGASVSSDIYLLDKLNEWVDHSNAPSGKDATAAYSHWMRTKSSPINGDYPILKYDNPTAPDYAVAGSKDGIMLEYGTSFNDILGRFNGYREGTLFIYEKLMKQAETRDAAAMVSDVITVSNHENVKIYIDEDIPVLQSEGNVLKNVYTCQELKIPMESWHTISSSLADSPIGIEYGNTDPGVTNFDNSNPCDATIHGGDESMFLTGTPIENIDLYCFYEPYYHWLNLKRNSRSHWHMNNHSVQIPYSGADNNKNDGTCILVPGKGYLAASFEQPTLMLECGTLNNGEITIPVTVEAGTHNDGSFAYPNEGTELRGYNLLGNPYQSYLSFAAFAADENNKKLWNEDSTPSYAVFNAKSGFYIPGTAAETSKGSAAAQGDINMHQGFFIVADNAGTARFDNTMRSDKAQEGTHFRGEGFAYPLVNLMVTDASGQGDIAVVEFDRPEYISASKMKSIGANGKVYFRHNNDDHALLFLDEPTDHLTVCFDAANDGSYTLTWNTANADFSYLHLIDNMTGKDIDMLTNECYTFSANSDDYKARFKMVFSYTGIGEEQAETDMAEASFAFVSNGDLIVNGEGNLQLIDVNGHVLYSTRLSDTQSRVSVPQVSAGIYLIRLNEKVQKIVIK